MNIKIEASRKQLSPLGGLAIANKILEISSLKETLKGCLPSENFRGTSSYKKFKAIMLSSVAGSECLDDFYGFRKDPAFASVMDGAVLAPNTYGDYLRAFNEVNLEKVRQALITQALHLRKAAFPFSKTFTLDVDSTSHPASSTSQLEIQCK